MNIYDIAEKAGVSIATVSRVLNGNSVVSSKTREKVELVMEEIGYSPNAFARGLMVDSMKMIGIMTSDLRDIYYASAVQTIENELRAKGYDVILCSTGEDIREKKKYIKLLLDKRVDGIILVGSVFKEKTDNSHIIQASKKVPVVMINGHIEVQNIYSILCDDAAGMYLLTEKLIEKGKKNIAYIYDAETLSGFEKMQGYKRALKENDIDQNQEYIIKVQKGIEGGIFAIQYLIDKKLKYDAIITSEDLLAVGAMKTLISKGIKIPEDVVVCGYNNLIIAICCTPELTTVDSKVEAVSSGAVKILCDVLEGRNVSSRTMIQPDIIIRQSSKKILNEKGVMYEKIYE